MEGIREWQSESVLQLPKNDAIFSLSIGRFEKMWQVTILARY